MFPPVLIYTRHVIHLVYMLSPSRRIYYFRYHDAPLNLESTAQHTLVFSHHPILHIFIIPLLLMQAMEELKENTKRYPLVRAASEESSSELSSSPFPGDTMPWNLSKHHQIKRSKSTSGDVHVLDSAERAVLRIAGKLGLKERGTHTQRTESEIICS